MGLETAMYIDGLVVTNPTLGDPVSAGDDHLRLIKVAIKNSFPNIAGAVNASQAEINHLVGVTSGVQDQLNAKSAAGHTHTETDIADGNLFARVASTENISGAWTFEQAPLFSQGVRLESGGSGYASIVSASGAGTGIYLQYQNLDYPLNQKVWLDFFNSTGWSWNLRSDDHTIVRSIFSASRSGNAVTAIGYGNATNNPSHTFFGAVNLNNGLVTTTAAIGSVSNTEIQYLAGVTSAIQTQLNGKAATSHSHNDLYYTEAEVNALLAALTASGSFTMSLRETSPSGTVIATGTATWKKTGGVVTLKVPASFWGFSSLGGTFYVSGLPAEIQIAGSGTAQLDVAVMDNGTLKSGYVQIGGANPGSLSIGCYQTGSFTASAGNKGFNYQSSLTYAI